MYIVCVRCPDFRDHAYLQKTLRQVEALLGSGIRPDGFKPEIFSRLGVYSQWSTHPDRVPGLDLRPVMMHTEWPKGTEARFHL
ncbi:hypothetical protein KIPB_004398 [Kipferlia bialata]|uniref:Uncharacterized protein n=1 Tax=Kipferlia bialata TaxID=797122 RepID=A0A9K3CTR1_9EUKA|nr:hypothetical protein KIPB_004398 [Kipferlia bialata]|eukprot:g4398.t1